MCFSLFEDVIIQELREVVLCNIFDLYQYFSRFTYYAEDSTLSSMRSSVHWHLSHDEERDELNNLGEDVGSLALPVTTSRPTLEIQERISQEDLRNSLTSGSEVNNYGDGDYYDHEDDDGGSYHTNEIGSGASHESADQPSHEQIQRIYYIRGLQKLESLQLIDLSYLANWKLSSSKQGFALSHLRDDTPDTYWQSDGSSGNRGSNSAGSTVNNQLANPHWIVIQFAKRVSLERISIFTNYSADESYTPCRIQILAGTSDDMDLSEVCTVNFSKPIGWSHIIFNGIRNDGVLKCFTVKLVILSNHQDGKDTRIRAIRCFGKKPAMQRQAAYSSAASYVFNDVLKDLSLGSSVSNESGLLLNSRNLGAGTNVRRDLHLRRLSAVLEDEDKIDVDTSNPEKDTGKVLNNVSEVIGFNSGFQSLELTSVSSIR